MIRILKHFFFLFGVLFIATAFTGAYFSDSTEVSGNSFETGTASNTDIVLNEILPDPSGDDNTAMTNGEWVEIFNNGDWAIDVGGWQIRDADGNSMTINNEHVISSTLLESGNWLTVYKNNKTSFSINNTGDETITIYDSLGNLIDTYSYYDSIVGRSYARDTDGTGGWVGNQTPTPGVTNG